MKDNFFSTQSSPGNRLANNKSSLDSKMESKSSLEKSELSTPVQRKGNNTGLPDNLKSGVERLSGYSMDDVKVHYNSDKPAQLKAHAYAQGTNIHIAPGQEKHVAHEAWHVVQQKQGRVQPTTQMKGMGINDNSLLEQEADVMGAKAKQSHSRNGDTASININTASQTATQCQPIQRVTKEGIDDWTEPGLEFLAIFDTLSNEIKDTIVNVTTLYDKGDPNLMRDTEKALKDAFQDYTLNAQKTMSDNMAQLKDELLSSSKFWTDFIHKTLGGGKAEKKVNKGGKSGKNNNADYSGILSKYEKIKKGVNAPQKRITLECAMGQGVIGNLNKYVLYSGNFSSCSPVYMYNRKSHMAGLFHYGAGSESQLNELDRMLKVIKPTSVGVGSNNNSMEGDFDVLKTFFKKKGVKTVEPVKSKSSFCMYLDHNEDLKMTTSNKGGKVLDLTQMEKVPKTLQEMYFYLVVDKNVFDPESFKGIAISASGFSK